jgi:hypothetical protein
VSQRSTNILEKYDASFFRVEEQAMQESKGTHKRRGVKDTVLGAGHREMVVPERKAWLSLAP